MPQKWQCFKGTTLLIPSGPNGGQHLFALMIDPVKVEGYGDRACVLLASITSIHAGVPYDDSCVLGPGDHPFLQHESYVLYSKARLDPVEHLEARVQEGIFTEKEACTPELIKKIIQGALKTRRIPLDYKRLLEKVIFG